MPPPHRAGSMPSGLRQPDGVRRGVGPNPNRRRCTPGPTDGSPRTPDHHRRRAQQRAGPPKAWPSLQIGTGRVRRVKPAQLVQVDRSPDEDQQLQQGQAVHVQRLHTFRNPGRQRQRDSREPRCREVGTGVEYGVSRLTVNSGLPSDSRNSQSARPGGTDGRPSTRSAS